MAFAHLEHRALNGLGVRVRGQRREGGGEVSQRRALKRFGIAELFFDPHEVVVIGDRVLHQTGEQRFGVRCGIWVVAADEAPEHGGRFGVRHAGEVQQHGEGDGAAGVIGQPAEMHMPGRIGQALRPRLSLGFPGIGDVFVHGARDDIEIEAFGALRLIVHELAQGFGGGVAEPFVHREAVALGFADFLSVLIEEKLIRERLRRRRAEDAAEFAGQTHAVDQILA